MPFWTREQTPERLLWCRDSRLASRVASIVGGARVLELESGWCLIGPAAGLSDEAVAAQADEQVSYGLVGVDGRLPGGERYLYALASAVQLSGLADRIGMDQTPLVAQTKLLDYFFALRSQHAIVFQPIVELSSLEAAEWECLLRPRMPMLPQGAAAIVEAAIATGRSVELDDFVVETILARARELRSPVAGRPLRLSLNLTPASLLDPRFHAAALTTRVHEASLLPRQVTLECTEQQAIPDVAPLRRRVRQLRRAGFGVSVDDAGAGYASFALIAALRPSTIKIDRQIVLGVARDVAKRALVEAFVSFASRIDARLVAEGIERRADLEALVGAGVTHGQGFLLGRPADEPEPARRSRAIAAFRAARSALRHRQQTAA